MTDPQCSSERSGLRQVELDQIRDAIAAYGLRLVCDEVGMFDVEVIDVSSSPTPQIAGGDDDIEGFHDEIRDAVLQAAEAIRKDDIRAAHRILAEGTRRAAISPQAQAGETPTAPAPGWLAPALDKAAERAAVMPAWMTRDELIGIIDRASGGYNPMRNAVADAILDVAQAIPASVEETLSLALAWGNAAGQATMNCNLRPERDAAWERLAEAVEGLAQGAQEPIGYAYDNEVQSSTSDWFAVRRQPDKHHVMPVYASPPAALPAGEDLADKIIADPKVVWLRECGFNSSARFEGELRAAIIRAASSVSSTTRETPAADPAIESWSVVEQLRANEGAEVILLCDNPDFNGQSNNAIAIVDDWTMWSERRFNGDTILDALRAALKARTDAGK